MQASERTTVFDVHAALVAHAEYIEATAARDVGRIVEAQRDDWVRNTIMAYTDATGLMIEDMTVVYDDDGPYSAMVTTSDGLVHRFRTGTTR